MIRFSFMEFRSQLAIFLLIQGIAGLIGGVVLLFLSFWWTLPLIVVIAVFLSWHWHDGRWWTVIHSFFLPLVVLALQLEIAPVWYLSAFALSWLVFGRVAVNRAPLYLSNRQALIALEKQLPQGARLLDIGAGTGTVLAWLVRRRPDLHLTGIEHAWLPWCIGRLRLPGRVNWLRGDYRPLDFADYDVTYAFLSPAPMADLWRKARAEMKAEALFLSNTFEVPGIEPDEIIELDDWKGGKLLLWRM